MKKSGCLKCDSQSIICKGRRGIRQRLQCKDCSFNFQDAYCYKKYRPKDDLLLKRLYCEGLGIRSLSRVMGYSPSVIVRRILDLASRITKPIYIQDNQIYEVDELWTYVGKNDSSHYVWIIYALNRQTNEVMDCVIGSRTKENLGKVIHTVKSMNPNKIITDKLNTYPNLIKPFRHDTHRYRNNHIERANLTLRTHIKRLQRDTICFSKSLKMLQATILLYLDFHNWRMTLR
jgi:IS1 family transposase/transposase-like protein